MVFWLHLAVLLDGLSRIGFILKRGQPEEDGGNVEQNCQSATKGNRIKPNVLALQVAHGPFRQT